MKRWSTVQDFIASGKAPTSETVAAFEGFASKGDGGASFWVKTGLTGVPSQSPTDLNAAVLTDSQGVYWRPTSGAIFYFNGTNQWFPAPFGDDGAGLYQFDGVGWNYYEQAGGAVSIAVTTGLITNAFNYDVGTALTFSGYSTPGDGGGAQWVKTSDVGTPSQTPAVRGDGTLTDALGSVWEIAETVIDVAMMGAKLSEIDNSASLIAALGTGLPVRANKPYSYDFAGASITYNGTALDIDFGTEIQVMNNFGGIDANSAISVKINGRIDCNNTRLINMVKCVSVESLDSSNFEIKNIRNVSPSSGEQTFVFEISNNIIDRKLNANFGSVKAVNLVTESQDFPNATPMTFIGGYGSGANHTQKHSINFDSLFVEEFYTVDESDGVSVIGGDSDFFRLFTNPTQLNINTLHIKNVGKRFIKTQEQVNCTVSNVYSELDSRFDASNYNGTFEGQNANSGDKTTFDLGVVEVNHANETLTPVFFNASGLEHEMYIGMLKGVNFAFFMNNVNASLSIKNSRKISGFKGNATLSDRIFIEKSSIVNFEPVLSSGILIRDSNISLLETYTSSSFPLEGAKMYNVELSNWNVDVRCAKIKECDGLTITYERGTGPRRPLRPSGNHSIMKGVRVIQNGGDAVDAAIESDGGAGDLIVRDFRSATVGCGFISTGSYDVVLDNCDGTITGAGVNSLLTATYS